MKAHGLNKKTTSSGLSETPCLKETQAQMQERASLQTQHAHGHTQVHIPHFHTHIKVEFPRDCSCVQIIGIDEPRPRVEAPDLW